MAILCCTGVATDDPRPPGIEWPGLRLQPPVRPSARAVLSCHGDPEQRLASCALRSERSPRGSAIAEAQVRS